MIKSMNRLFYCFYKMCKGLKRLKILLFFCNCLNMIWFPQYTVEPHLRGHPDKRPTPLNRPLDYINLNTNVLMSTTEERPPLLKGHTSGEKGWPHKRGSTVVRLFLINLS